MDGDRMGADAVRTSSRLAGALGGARRIISPRDDPPPHVSPPPAPMTDTATFTAMGAVPFLSRYPLTRVSRSTVPFPPPLPGAGPRPQRIQGNPAGGQGEIEQSQRVLYFDIATNPDDLAVVTAAASGPPVKAVVGPVGIPLFHLPYNNDQNFRITLRDMQGVGNVDFFITELVDGCSIYVEGTPQEPTAYHLNAITVPGFANNPMLTEDQVYRLKWLMRFGLMDGRFRNDGARPAVVAAAHPALQPSRKLENRDYMIRPGSPEQDALEQSLPALQAALTAPTVLGGQSVDVMRLLTTQGTVFGVRDGTGSWHFYVQMRALVEYFHRQYVERPVALGRMDRVRRAFGQYQPQFGPPAVDINLVSLGTQWIIRSVQEFWPGNTTGRTV